MKQTVEDAAKEAAEDCYECQYNDSLEMRLVKEAFRQGAEWQSKQSPWISVNERLPEPNKLVLCRMVSNGAIVSGYIVVSTGRSPYVRQTEDLNLRIGTTTSVTCGCPSRL